MKKKWLVLGLTAVMSLGLFVACGDGRGSGSGDGSGSGNGGATGKGEQVTQEQWTSVFENIDYSYAVGEASGSEQYEGTTYTYKTKAVYRPNMYYMEYEETMTDGTRTETEGEACWTVKADNGIYYSFEANKLADGTFDTATESWEAEEYEESIVLNFNYWTEDWGYIFEGDEFINSDMTAFTYDSEKGIYYKEKSATTEEGTRTARVEIVIKNNKLYSLKIDATATGEYAGSECATYTFIQEEINLPKQDELNTMIASTKAYYRLVELTMSGRTYRPGDEFMFGYMVSSDSYTLTLKADGTAYFIVKLAGQVDQQTGTWEETDEAIIVTIANQPQTFVKNGTKITSEEGSNQIVLTT